MSATDSHLIPCPCCHGTGEYHDKYGTGDMETCTACHGSGALEVSEKNADRIERMNSGEYVPPESHGPANYWTDAEVKVLMIKGTDQEALARLNGRGYSRTIAAVRGKRRVLRLERGRKPSSS